MEIDFQPSIRPLLDLLSVIDIGGFLCTLCTFLKNNRGKFPAIMTDFASPGSPLYNHLSQTFLDKVPVPPNLTSTGYNQYYYNNIIMPAQAFLTLGEISMAEKLGAQFSGGQTTAKPESPPPPKNAEATRPVVPPPRRPQTFSFKGADSAPSSSSDNSENKVYMSKLPEGVKGDIDLMKEVLNTLKFPPLLVQAVRFIRPIMKEGVQSCFLVGPLDNPQWADQMLAAKRQSAIKDSVIHMGKARPQKPMQQSPGRPQRVEDLTARLNRISLGGGSPRSAQSPQSQSPTASFGSPFSVVVQSGGGDSRKRGLDKQEGQRRLDFEGAEKESMVLSSPSPNRKPKLPNVGQTPAEIRVRKQSGQGGGTAAQGGGAPNPNRNGGGDDDDDGGRSSADNWGDVDQVNLDDAFPQTPAANAGKNKEDAKGDNAMPN